MFYRDFQMRNSGSTSEDMISDRGYMIRLIQFLVCNVVVLYTLYSVQCTPERYLYHYTGVPLDI